MQTQQRSFYLFFAFLLLVLGGCAPKPKMTLMPPPVMYQGALIDPFRHLGEEQRNTSVTVHYATNTEPSPGATGIAYGNKLDTQIHLGTARIQLGHAETTWDELYAFSTKVPDGNSLPMNLVKVEEVAVWDDSNPGPEKPLATQHAEFFSRINDELAEAADKEIMIYVHGTKVDFENSVMLTAEVDHFAGRDFVGIGFAWPSHQNIFHYLLRTDVKLAHQSSSALLRLIELLAEHTDARQINILSYSAGGKVASRALHELRQTYPKLNSEELLQHFRIGSVVFASADVEIDHFLQRIDSISEISRQAVVTVSDYDTALQAAHTYMGGRVRTGTVEAEREELEYIQKHHLQNVEIIDVSKGKEERGFDITGHHYWYRHPWMSSDIIFLMRTDLPPSRRGLRETELQSIWYLSREYPDMIRSAVKKELDGQW